MRQAQQSGQQDATSSRGWSGPLLGGLSNPLLVFYILIFKDVMQKAGIYCSIMKGYEKGMPLKKELIKCVINGDGLEMI